MWLVFVCILVYGTSYWITTPVTACGEKSYMIFECVKEHNRRRAWHWAPNMHWDEILAKKAQDKATHLENRPHVQTNLYNSSSEKGINIYRSSWLDPSCYEAVSEWYAEKQKYKSRNLCTKPPARWSNQLVNEIRHFTQVVWKNSIRVGVGRTKHFVVAMYSPPGNDFNRTSENVRC